MTIPAFPEAHLRRIAELLADAASHDELTGLFRQCGMVGEPRGDSAKWRRILFALETRQQRDRCGNNVGAFIQAIMDPVRFTNRPESFAAFRDKLNEMLAFSALHLGEDGKLTPVTRARTLTEAQERAGRLRAELLRRKVHPDVLRFCKAELLQENYFHAVFEATKSVAEKIRERTGLTSDGADLVDTAFGLHAPLLAINSLCTETEQSEQKGFANLLRGMFGTFRNVTAHAPKIIWSISEEDAFDLLGIVSYLHRRLDAAARVPEGLSDLAKIL